jgi:hypothetical protein
MFERYTEKARRVIFFARYEASQYGSPVIDTEHLLLGLLREDTALMQRYAGPLRSSAEIRTEIERVIQRSASIPTSVEVPLSTAAKRVLNFAGEEADRLGHRHIGTEHILLAFFRLPDSLAARILVARGAEPNTIREQLAKGSAPTSRSIRPLPDVLIALNSFLGILKEGASDKLPDLFHNTGQFIDSTGKRWLGPAEIEKGSGTLLAPFAKRSATFRVEDTTAGPSQTFVASVLWEFAAASADRSKSLLRMSIVLAWSEEDWTILLVQITPVIYP